FNSALTISKSSFLNNTSEGGEAGAGATGVSQDGGQGGVGGAALGGAIYGGVATVAFNLTQTTFTSNRAFAGDGGQGGDSGDEGGFAGNAGDAKGGAVYLDSANIVASQDAFNSNLVRGGAGRSGGTGTFE